MKDPPDDLASLVVCMIGGVLLAILVVLAEVFL